jgi:hypothetical protein
MPRVSGIAHLAGTSKTTPQDFKEKNNKRKRWTRDKNAPAWARHSRQSTSFKKMLCTAAYLRAAQAYMLISMPTGTSTIFGAFQAILALLK